MHMCSIVQGMCVAYDVDAVLMAKVLCFSFHLMALKIEKKRWMKIVTLQFEVGIGSHVHMSR